MKVLVYKWGALTEQFLCNGLKECEYEVMTFEEKIKDYDYDGTFSLNLMKCIYEVQADYVMSFDYFPVISSVCQTVQVKYISWVYDSPHNTLYSKNINNLCNYIFVFDRMQFHDLKELGVTRVFYSTLATDAAFFQKVIADTLSSGVDNENNTYEVSFVGSLYRNVHNYFEELNINFDKVTNKELEVLSGIIDNQICCWTKGRMRERLTEKLTHFLMENLHLYLGPDYGVPDNWMAAAVMNKKVTVEERKRSLEYAAQVAEVYLFTDSIDIDIKNVKKQSYVNYFSEMPLVFRNSKINLNITLRSIESGIPLRALDIMASGGFLLSNYQKELDELFEDGKELVLFRNSTELVEKIVYYLENEEERKKIASNGLEKVKKYYSYKEKISSIFRIVEGKEAINRILEKGTGFEQFYAYRKDPLFVEMVQNDTELAQFLVMCDIAELEERWGFISIFSFIHNTEEINVLYTKIKFYLHRLELNIGEPYEGEMVEFLKEFPVSRCAIMLIADNCVFRKNIVGVKLAKILEKCGRVDDMKPILYWSMPEEMDKLREARSDFNGGSL